MSAPRCKARGAGPVLRAALPRPAAPRAPEPAAPAPAGPIRRPAQVAQYLAFAHELRRLFDAGAASSVGDMARRLGVSQPRVTQLMGLTFLAPDIQEEVLAMEAVDGVEPAAGHVLRRVLLEVDWRRQRARWAAEARRLRQRSAPGAKRR